MVYKLSELWSMSAPELASLSSKDLRKNYQNIKNIVKSRISTFEKHGIKVPGNMVAGGLPSSKGREDEELLQSMKDALAWMRGGHTTLKGYLKAQESFREKMQEAMPDIDLSTPEKMNRFGYFMGDMQDRYGEMWHAISNQARDIYRDLTEINEDPYQFMANYDYWASNIEALNKAKAAARQRGRYSTKLSTYINKLKAGKISGRPGGQRKK